MMRIAGYALFHSLAKENKLSFGSAHFTNPPLAELALRGFNP
jgi:hypothetical protein